VSKTVNTTNVAFGVSDGLDTDTVYVLIVSAVGPDGAVGPADSTSPAALGDATPTAVEIVTAEAVAPNLVEVTASTVGVDDEGSPIIGVVLELWRNDSDSSATSPNATWSVPVDPAAAVASVTYNFSVVQGVPYFATAAAVSARGRGDRSNASNVVTTYAGNPSPPGLVLLSTMPSGEATGCLAMQAPAKLWFTLSENQGGVDVEGALVTPQCRVNSDGAVQMYAPRAPNNGWTALCLPVETLVSCRIRETNSAHNDSAFSPPAWSREVWLSGNVTGTVLSACEVAVTPNTVRVGVFDVVVSGPGPGGGVDGGITGYHLFIFDISDESATLNQPLLTVDVVATQRDGFNLTVDGNGTLGANVLYRFVVAAMNKYGEGELAFSDVAQGATAPSDAQIIDVVPGRRSVGVVFLAPKQSGGTPLVSFAVGLQNLTDTDEPVGDVAWSLPIAYVGSGTDPYPSPPFEDLVPGRYLLLVSANNVDRIPNMCASTSATAVRRVCSRAVTVCDVPTMIRPSLAQTHSSHTLQVTWRNANSSACQVRNYTVRLYSASYSTHVTRLSQLALDKTFNVGPDQDWLVLPGVRNDRVYYAEVTATNDLGESARATTLRLMSNPEVPTSQNFQISLPGYWLPITFASLQILRIVALCINKMVRCKRATLRHHVVPPVVVDLDARGHGRVPRRQVSTTTQLVDPDYDAPRGEWELVVGSPTWVPIVYGIPSVGVDYAGVILTLLELFRRSSSAGLGRTLALSLYSSLVALRCAFNAWWAWRKLPKWIEESATAADDKYTKLRYCTVHCTCCVSACTVLVASGD
jgi:hypothetical protein